MKIDYRNFPILKNLKDEKIKQLLVNSIDTYDLYPVQNIILSSWHSHCKSFKKEINIISKPFDQACMKARKSLLELYTDILQDDDLEIEVGGTFIVDKIVYMIYFKKEGNLNTGYSEISFYVFSPTGGLIAVCNTDNNTNGIMWISKTLGYSDIEKVKQDIGEQMIHIILYSMFKKYASVETKILSPHQRRRDISCFFRNDIDLPINYLDSKWFTTLVKSEGFNVRGHFRLQPKKKDGEWTRELIWINEFRKTGYTAPARRLSYIEKI